MKNTCQKQSTKRCSVFPCHFFNYNMWGTNIDALNIICSMELSILTWLVSTWLHRF